MAKTRLAVLISGRGTNLQALIDACQKADYPAEIALVISNRPNADGLTRAKNAGIATRIVDHKPFGNDDNGRLAFEAELDEALNEAAADYVCLAGFMRLFTQDFTVKWRGKMINIHPSLLPAFKGVNVHQRMIEAGVKVAGCTVHFVTGEMDGGPIIGQAALDVHPKDTADTLAQRILALEHQLYPNCVELLVTGKVRIGANNRTVLGEEHSPDAHILMPTLVRPASDS